MLEALLEQLEDERTLAERETLHGELQPFGIGVSVLCPSFVKTRLADSHRNRPAELGPGPDEPDAFMTASLATATEPEVIGACVLRGVKRGDLYILPHPDFKLAFQGRANGILEAFDNQ